MGVRFNVSSLSIDFSFPSVIPNRWCYNIYVCPKIIDFVFCFFIEFRSGYGLLEDFLWPLCFKKKVIYFIGFIEEVEIEMKRKEGYKKHIYDDWGDFETSTKIGIEWGDLNLISI